jgi:hypothetical protein
MYVSLCESESVRVFMPRAGYACNESQPNVFTIVVGAVGALALPAFVLTSKLTRADEETAK